MHAHYTEPEPGPGAAEPQKSEPGAMQAGLGLTNGHMLVDPQQVFREYTSSGTRGNSIAPPPPQTPRPTALPQPYPGVGYPPATPWPSYPAGPSQSMPPYLAAGPAEIWHAPHSTSVPGAGYPGYNPSATYPSYPGYSASAMYSSYPGSYGAYPGYGYPMWSPPVPARAKRDTYLRVVAIAALVCSILVLLGGLGSLAILGLTTVVQAVSLRPMGGHLFFAGVMGLLTFALAGLVGGGFGLYHSLRALALRKPSRQIWLPRFWIFLLCYLATLGLGLWLHTLGVDMTVPPLLGLLVYLSAIFPALTILALGVRRLSLPKMRMWPTSWRRLALAVVSGATLSIGLALILELLLGLLLFGIQRSGLLQYMSDPNASNPNPSLYGILLVTVAVIAPLVEETVKPLAVLVLIGRVKSKAEAFTLGLACGVGFNLVETTLYISQGSTNWLDVALARSGAGLLHGFGAGMVALGWYILTHREEGRWQKRTLLACGCAGYAILQHAIWNGSLGLALLPGPIGTFFSTWSWNAGPVSIDGIELLNSIEVIAMLLFFIYITGRLRTRKTAPPGQQREAQVLGNTPALPVGANVS